MCIASLRFALLWWRPCLSLVVGAGGVQDVTGKADVLIGQLWGLRLRPGVNHTLLTKFKTLFIIRRRYLYNINISLSLSHTHILTLSSSHTLSFTHNLSLYLTRSLSLALFALWYLSWPWKSQRRAWTRCRSRKCGTPSRRSSRCPPSSLLA